MDYPLGVTTRAHHYGISVADLESMTRWYEEVLGAVVTGGRDPNAVKTSTIRFLTVGGFSFELVAAAKSTRNPRQGVSLPALSELNGPIHMAFTVDDCAEVAAELRRRGVKFARDVIDYPEVGMRAAHFWDIEGNLLEIVEIMS